MMQRLVFSSVACHLAVCTAAVSMAATPEPTDQSSQSAPAQPAFYTFAPTPPMGWNSYDAFGDSVTEDEVMANARNVKDKLLAHGWNYIVVDFRWYDPEPTGDDHALNQKHSGAKLAADAFGRMVRAENRFPSSAGGKGFKPLADKLHDMGLKFGFHYMRGIPRQSVNNKTPIEGSTFTAADAGDAELTGKWTVRDIWQHKDLGPADTKVTMTVPPHWAALLKLSHPTR